MRFAKVGVLVVVALSWGCGGDDGGGEACATAADCEGGQRCVNGRCTEPTDGGRADASRDAGFDAEGCSGEPPSVMALAPARGARTGSVHAPPASQVLRPLFRWEPAPGADTYELQVDDSCDLGASSMCAFPSPEVDARGLTGTSHRPETDLPVARSAPVGTRYYWRVRACAGDCCGPWSAVRYLDVGRLPGDLNGDGYADLAVGARQQGLTDEGHVFVYFGEASGGVPGAPSSTLPAPALDGAYGPWNFGFSVSSTGDLNGDGYADLVVGAENYGGASEGAAFVYFGGPAGPATTPDLTLLNPGDPALGRPKRFGTSVASGDLNGDGYADLAVGARWQEAPEVNEGNVFVYWGGPAGLDSAPLVIDSPHDEANGNFGWSVSADGDFDGDGYVDLVVSAFKEDAVGAIDAGWAYVFSGGPGAFPTTPSLEIANPAAENAQDAFFGVCLASAADLNGDGFGDLVVGASQQSDPVAGVVSAGAAFVYLGGRAGLDLDPHVLLAPDEQRNASYGRSVATGDLDGDGWTDLVVGAPLWDSDPTDGGNEGRVFVYAGGEGRFGSGSASESPAAIVDLPALAVRSGSNFGWSLSSNDWDGNGYADLAVGAHRVDAPEPNEGNVFVYLGGPAGVPTSPSVALDNPAGQIEAFFGWSLASAVGVEGDRRRAPSAAWVGALGSWGRSTGVCGPAPCNDGRERGASPWLPRTL